MTTKLQTPSTSLVVHYPEAIKFAETQDGIFWTANEINVEKDVQSLRVDMTESEYHGVVTTLKLFTRYELFAGTEYWLGRVLNSFPRPEIQRMAATFGYFELGVHGPFYNKINEALMLNTEEFYSEYTNDDVLRSRMDFIDELINDPDDLVSLGTFSLIEGAVLYSSFAFLKHFQSKGKNKLLNVVRGINFSVRDENLHCIAGSWLYRSLRDERLKADPTYSSTYTNAVERITEASRAIYHHECQIVDMIFEKGPIEGITSEQMKTFVASRINLCLSHLGIDPIFEVFNDIVSGWFYENINSVQFNDFFTGIGSSYSRNWKEGGFTW